MSLDRIGPFLLSVLFVSATMVWPLHKFVRFHLPADVLFLPELKARSADDLVEGERLYQIHADGHSYQIGRLRSVAAGAHS
ncbi:MAG: hypothetical protein ACREAM_24630 [Blastocatellia bacterium]